MTKDDLENRFDICFDACTRASEGGYGADTTDRQRLWEHFYPIVREHAKQQTVSFTNWTTSAECNYSCSDEDEWNNIHNPQETITSEQLYDKFIQWQIEQQNKP